MKYVKLFETHSEYETYINDEPILPNISFCKNLKDGHFSPWVETKIVAKFNVTSTTSSVRIIQLTNAVSKIEIDGIVQQTIESTYTFETIGEHIIKYKLANPSTIIAGAFQYVPFTELYIPEGVTTIEQNAFSSTQLTSITLPNSLISIGNEAFKSDNKLTSITIPENVTTIGGRVFYNCSNLTTVTINGGNITWGQDCFTNCNNITKVIIKDIGAWCGNTYGNKYSNPLNFGHNLYSDENTQITNLIIPNNITTINDSAFTNCTNITSVTIPNNITTINSAAFSYCSGLTGSLIIPNSVTKISASCFLHCENITTIILGNNITVIEGQGFAYCTSLNSITIHATTPPTLTSSAFNSTNNCTIYVPSESVAAYKAATNWKTYASRIQAIP